MHDSLYKVHLQQQVPSHWYNALASGLYRGCQAQPPNLEAVDMDTQQLDEVQLPMKWMQLYYGRFSTTWVCILNSIQNTIVNRINFFYSKVITVIWMAVLSQWSQHNSHLRPPNPIQDDRTQLHNQVYQILMDTQLDPLLQDLVSTCNPEVLMRWHTKYIDKGSTTVAITYKHRKKQQHYKSNFTQKISTINLQLFQKQQQLVHRPKVSCNCLN